MDMLETLKPSIKGIIRAADPKTLTDLINRATLAEADEAEYTGKKTRVEDNGRGKAASAATTTTTIEQAQPSSRKCLYCPDYHFHRNCLVARGKRRDSLQTENWRRAADDNAPTPRESNTARDPPHE